MEASVEGQHVADIRRLVRQWTRDWSLEQGLSNTKNSYGMNYVVAHLRLDGTERRLFYELGGNRDFPLTPHTWNALTRLITVVRPDRQNDAIAEIAGLWTAADNRRPDQYIGRLRMPDRQWQRALTIADYSADLPADLKAAVLEDERNIVTAKLDRLQDAMARHQDACRRADVSRRLRRDRDQAQLDALRTDLAALQAVVYEQDRVLADYRRQLAQSAEAAERNNAIVAQLHQQHAAELEVSAGRLTQLERERTDALQKHAATLAELRQEHAETVGQLQRQRDVAYASATASEAERRDERQWREAERRRREAAERQAAAERAERDQLTAERDDLHRQLEAGRHQPLPSTLAGTDPVLAGAPTSFPGEPAAAHSARPEHGTPADGSSRPVGDVPHWGLRWWGQLAFGLLAMIAVCGVVVWWADDSVRNDPSTFPVMSAVVLAAAHNPSGGEASPETIYDLLVANAQGTQFRSHLVQYSSTGTLAMGQTLQVRIDPDDHDHALPADVPAVHPTPLGNFWKKLGALTALLLIVGLTAIRRRDDYWGPCGMLGLYARPAGAGRLLRFLDRRMSTRERRQQAKACFERDIRCCTDPHRRIQLASCHADAVRGGPSAHIHYVKLSSINLRFPNPCECSLRWCLRCRRGRAQKIREIREITKAVQQREFQRSSTTSPPRS